MTSVRHLMLLAALVPLLGHAEKGPASPRVPASAPSSESSDAREVRLEELRQVFWKVYHGNGKGVFLETEAKKMSKPDLPLLAALLKDGNFALNSMAVEAMEIVEPNASVPLVIQVLPECQAEPAIRAMWFLQRKIEDPRFLRDRLRLILLRMFDGNDREVVDATFLKTFGMVAHPEDLPRLRSLRKEWEKMLAEAREEFLKSDRPGTDFVQVGLERKLTAIQMALARMGDPDAISQILAELKTPMSNTFDVWSKLSTAAQKAAYSRQAVFIPALIHIMAQPLPTGPWPRNGCVFPDDPWISAGRALDVLVPPDQQPTKADKSQPDYWGRWWEKRQNQKASEVKPAVSSQSQRVGG